MPTAIKWTRREDKGAVLLAATITVPTEGWEINGKALTGEVAEYLGAFALRQVVANTYAGIGPEADARVAAKGKIEDLMEGRVASRGSDPLGSYRRQFVRATLQNAKRADDKAAFDKIEAKAQAKWLDDYFAAASDEYKAAITKLAEERLEADRVAKAAAVELDI